jgi:hypothetical protein
MPRNNHAIANASAASPFEHELARAAHDYELVDITQGKYMRTVVSDQSALKRAPLGGVFVRADDLPMELDVYCNIDVGDFVPVAKHVSEQPDGFDGKVWPGARVGRRTAFEEAPEHIRRDFPSYPPTGYCGRERHACLGQPLGINELAAAIPLFADKSPVAQFVEQDHDSGWFETYMLEPSDVVGIAAVAESPGSQQAADLRYRHAQKGRPLFYVYRHVVSPDFVVSAAV